MARALPKQYIDKGKVWTVFIGSAASLFILTVAAENNGSWFPAIARANAAMAQARKKAEQVSARTLVVRSVALCCILLHVSAI
jgi:hypothetical protein